uniref:Uncharacterized protein n=1 Tax=Romanomermis culicivorax TaxID=13658 RepID=A0A915K407_ROMCU
MVEDKDAAVDEVTNVLEGGGRPRCGGNGADIDANVSVQAGIIADAGNPIPNGGHGRCRRPKIFAYRGDEWRPVRPR